MANGQAGGGSREIRAILGVRMERASTLPETPAALAFFGGLPLAKPIHDDRFRRVKDA